MVMNAERDRIHNFDIEAIDLQIKSSISPPKNIKLYPITNLFPVSNVMRIIERIIKLQ
jgi:hypothetical protein